ncbi:hypothetical protein Glove_396g111 [Diversispora epigaea]|uniref:Uncharacterized protein n=1 Tax=Diversispora epigaea TaxID=1348612 RepID=A0A397H5Z7_9GLOM|nr:hypothetical protein Glove_396g111 [Diversispora epigaea]
MLLNLAQLIDKTTNAKYYTIKVNQEETLYQINYEKEFIIQYNDLMKYSNNKIEIGFQFPEISHKTLCKKIQRVVKTYKLFEKIGTDKIEYLKAYRDLGLCRLVNEISSPGVYGKIPFAIRAYDSELAADIFNELRPKINRAHHSVG